MIHLKDAWLILGSILICHASQCTPGLQEERCEAVSLLQMRASRQHRKSDAQSKDSWADPQSLPLERARPFYWVHVPKCGGGFVNTLIHTPQICENVSDATLIGLDIGGLTPGGFLEQHRSHCPGLVAPRGIARDFGDHGGFGDLYEENLGRAVIMLRQPEQRIMSAYYYNQAAWPYPTPAKDVRQYAQVLAGCAVRMLTRGGRWNSGTDRHVSNACGGPAPPTAAEVTLAKHRLRDGFAFVGLTEHWALSVCLFHKMFGGPCHHYEFWNTHPGRTSHSEEGYDISMLKGFRDEYDGALYSKASALFRQQLQSFNVSMESCHVCFAQAGRTAV